MECSGDGVCLEQSCCTCDPKADECTCEHKDHGEYYHITHCTPVNCPICGRKLPLWVYDANNMMCTNCAVILGPIKWLNTTGECNICSETESLIELKCKHRLCYKCWYKLRDGSSIDDEWTNNYEYRGCPFCRDNNEWTWMIRCKSTMDN